MFGEGKDGLIFRYGAKPRILRIVESPTDPKTTTHFSINTRLVRGGGTIIGGEIPIAPFRSPVNLAKGQGSLARHIVVQEAVV